VGHLLFLGLAVFFFMLITGRIYYDYRCAIKNKEKEEIGFAEIPIGGKYFSYKKPFGIICLFLIPSYWVIVFLSCSHLLKKNDLDSQIIYWFLIDSVLPISAIFLVAFIAGMRSFVFIHQNGFDFRGAFRKKAFLQDEIEKVCRTEEFIFIKQKEHKIPLVIENKYHDDKEMYRMLCELINES
jgi:predicted membrane metal-binding protein